MIDGRGIDIFTSESRINALNTKGHTVVLNTSDYGNSQCITLDLETGMLTGVADPRKNGAAVGVHL